MGFFNNYTKPGPGVRKDAPRKKHVFLFFELLGRKLGSYIKLNVTYLITCIPAFAVIMHLLYSILIEFAKPEAGDYEVLFLLAIIVAAFITLVFGLSPFSAGYFYILKNFSEETHAWVFSDFFEKFRKNVKQSLLTFVIDLVVVIFMILTIRLYILLMSSSLGNMVLIPIAVLVLLLAIYSVMVPYKWTMIVMIELKLRHIYKNAMLLAFGEVKRTLFLIIASLVYFAFIGHLLFHIPVIGVIVYFLVGCSAYGLIQQINLYPVIKKHLIMKQGELE